MMTSYPDAGKNAPFHARTSFSRPDSLSAASDQSNVSSVVCELRSRVNLPNSDLSGVTFATYDFTISDADIFMKSPAAKIAAAMSRRQDEAEVQFLRSYLRFDSPQDDS